MQSDRTPLTGATLSVSFPGTYRYKGQAIAFHQPSQKWRYLDQNRRFQSDIEEDIAQQPVVTEPPSEVTEEITTSTSFITEAAGLVQSLFEGPPLPLTPSPPPEEEDSDFLAEELFEEASEEPRFLMAAATPTPTLPNTRLEVKL
jgi:hypothetical protein